MTGKRERPPRGTKPLASGVFLTWTTRYTMGTFPLGYFINAKHRFQNSTRCRIALGEEKYFPELVDVKVLLVFLVLSTVKVRIPGLGGRLGGPGRSCTSGAIAGAWSPIMCAWAACNGAGRIPGLDQAGARGPNRAHRAPVYGSHFYVPFLFHSDLLKYFVCRDGKPRVRLECSEARLLGEPTHGPIDPETDERPCSTRVIS